jgi:outer membrane protein assembly factor BamE (lipoprotein component of BamABCDE complex)
VRNYGYDLDLKNLEKLKINKSTREDVINILGSPSTVSGFTDDEWYYVTVQTTRKSMFNPRVTERDIVQLKFRGNILTHIEVRQDQGKKDMNFCKDESPVHGNDSTALKDMFYNMGRFSKLTKKQ